MGRRGWTFLVVAALSVMGLSMSVDVAPARALRPEAARYLEATNALRANLGIQQLQNDPELTALAQAWAEHMAATYTLGHPPDITAGVSSPWRLLGDNMAMGSNFDLAWNGLVNSPVHYKNLSEPRFTHVGTGVAFAADGTQWVEQWFMELGDASILEPPAEPEPEPAPAPVVTPPPPPPTPLVEVLPNAQVLPVHLAVIPPIDYGQAPSEEDEQASLSIEDASGSSVPWVVWIAAPAALLLVVASWLALRGRRPGG